MDIMGKERKEKAVSEKVRCAEKDLAELESISDHSIDDEIYALHSIMRVVRIMIN